MTTTVNPGVDPKINLRPAVAHRRFYAGRRYLTELLAKDPRPSSAQLRELAQMLLNAADESDAAR